MKQLKRATRRIDPIKINRPNRKLKQVDSNLERKTIRRIKQTNRQLRKLRQYTGEVDSWAVKKLSERLNSGSLDAYKKGRIKLPKESSNFDLYAINQAIELFKKSKTSTIKGIKAVERKQIRNIKRRLSGIDEEVSTEDARFLYNAMGDELFNDIRGSFTPSEMQAIVMRAREEKQDKKDLFEILSESNDYSNDKEISRKFDMFFKKYVVA